MVISEGYGGFFLNVCSYYCVFHTEVLNSLSYKTLVLCLCTLIRLLHVFPLRDGVERTLAAGEGFFSHRGSGMT